MILTQNSSQKNGDTMKKKVFVPPIKSQGIKTKMVPWIDSIVENRDFEVWIEPFMGTGVVGFNISAKKSICGDTNPHIINFYQELQKGAIDSKIVKKFLQKEGQILLDTEGEHYYKVRERFNEKHNPLDFLFLSRSCFNGMMRFNKKGGYNVPFCKKPNRFAQALVTKISNQVERISYVIGKGDFEFKNQDFDESIKEAGSNDLIYCDPPYLGRNVDYFDSWSEENELNLYNSLNESKASFLVSTWLVNKYRKNEYIFSLWNDMNIDFNEHFYHVGGKESNRNAVYEAVLSNFDSDNFVAVEDVMTKIGDFKKDEGIITEYSVEDNQLRLFLDSNKSDYGYRKQPVLFSVID